MMFSTARPSAAKLDLFPRQDRGSGVLVFNTAHSPSPEVPPRRPSSVTQRRPRQCSRESPGPSLPPKCRSLPHSRSASPLANAVDGVNWSPSALGLSPLGPSAGPGWAEMETQPTPEIFGSFSPVRFASALARVDPLRLDRRDSADLRSSSAESPDMRQLRRRHSALEHNHERRGAASSDGHRATRPPTVDANPNSGDAPTDNASPPSIITMASARPTTPGATSACGGSAVLSLRAHPTLFTPPTALPCKLTRLDYRMGLPTMPGCTFQQPFRSAEEMARVRSLFREQQAQLRANPLSIPATRYPGGYGGASVPDNAPSPNDPSVNNNNNNNNNAIIDGRKSTESTFAEHLVESVEREVTRQCLRDHRMASRKHWSDRENRSFVMRMYDEQQAKLRGATVKALRAEQEQEALEKLKFERAHRSLRIRQKTERLKSIRRWADSSDGGSDSDSLSDKNNNSQHQNADTADNDNNNNNHKNNNNNNNNNSKNDSSSRPRRRRRRPLGVRSAPRHHNARIVAHDPTDPADLYSHPQAPGSAIPHHFDGDGRTKLRSHGVWHSVPHHHHGGDHDGDDDDDDDSSWGSQEEVEVQAEVARNRQEKPHAFLRPRHSLSLPEKPLQVIVSTPVPSALDPPAPPAADLSSSSAWLLPATVLVPVVPSVQQSSSPLATSSAETRAVSLPLPLPAPQPRRATTSTTVPTAPTTLATILTTPSSNLATTTGMTVANGWSVFCGPSGLPVAIAKPPAPDASSVLADGGTPSEHHARNTSSPYHGPPAAFVVPLPVTPDDHQVPQLHSRFRPISAGPPSHSPPRHHSHSPPTADATLTAASSSGNGAVLADETAAVVMFGARTRRSDAQRFLQRQRATVAPVRDEVVPLPPDVLVNVGQRGRL